MVSRIGDKVNFNLEEQLEFNVNPEVSVESAFETAVAFDAVAKQLDAQAAEMSGRADRDSLTSANTRRTRAARLDMMSKQLFGIAGPEIADSATVLLYTDDN